MSVLSVIKSFIAYLDENCILKFDDFLGFRQI